MVGSTEQAFRIGFCVATLVCVALMGLNSLTRIRDFTPDSMSYVDVARNFASGRGLSQSALGFGRARFSPEDPIPAPFTAHAPGFSIAIALATLTGLRFTDAALLLPVVFLALSIWVAFLLASECWDEAIGCLGVALLLNYYPIRHVAAVAWSESMAIFFALATLWLMARRERRGAAPRHVWLIGLCAGLAFAIRYPMAPLVLIAGLAIVRQNNGMQPVRDAGWLVVGFMCSAGLVLMRNLVLTGTWMGAALNPYHTPIIDSLRNTLWALSECYSAYYLETPPRLLELRLLVASLLISVIVLAVQGRLRSVTWQVFVRRGPCWVALWALTYLAFLVIARSRTWFDDITHRLTVPGTVGLVLLWGALAAKTTRVNRKVSALIAMGLIAAAMFREGRFLYQKPPVPKDVVPPVPRLVWVENNTTERDLIIGDYAMDIPFFFDNYRAIVFEHYPYTVKLAHDDLSAYLNQHCDDYDHAYLIVRDWYGKDRMAWRRAFGPLIAALTTGDMQSYPEYSLIAKLEDSYVFGIRKGDCGH